MQTICPTRHLSFCAPSLFTARGHRAAAPKKMLHSINIAQQSQISDDSQFSRDEKNYAIPVRVFPESGSGPSVWTFRENPDLREWGIEAHRSGRRPLFLRVNPSSRVAFFVGNLRQSATFSVEPPSSTHLSFSCSRAETGMLASVAVNKASARMMFIMMLSYAADCSQCRCARTACASRVVVRGDEIDACSGA